MNVLWPRLQRPIAMQRLREIRAGARPAPSSTHPLQTYASTGGARADAAALDRVRKVILDTAEVAGYPKPLKDGVAFDRALAPMLYEVMPMPLGEAANQAVWNFISTVVAPDVTAWRFGLQNDERWVCNDRTRHMFSRLWWQAHQLTTRSSLGRDCMLLNGLSESDLNQMLERTSIGGCGPLVRSLSRHLVSLNPTLRNREIVRNSCLALLRLLAVVDPYSLAEDELDHLVTGAIANALRSSQT